MISKQFDTDVTDYWIPSKIQRIPAPSALEFYRDYVSSSIPVILSSNLIDHWTAFETWTSSYLGNLLHGKQFPINITPDGYGDHLLQYNSELYFIEPEEQLMTMEMFFATLRDSSSTIVPYLSQQNDNFHLNFQELFPDIDTSLSLAVEAFGNQPEAVNLWIGDDRSISSLHKDHYENMYCVVRGKKRFLLYPPSDIAYLKERSVLSGKYVYSNIKQTNLRPFKPDWYIELGKDMTPWILPESMNHPSLHPIECIVNAGEVLYLPSLWYHQVSQIGETIAVNYWHDMKFDCKYVYYNLIHSLATKEA